MNPPVPSSLSLDTRPRVLVLVATYNGEQWLDEQLASVAAQQGVEVSVLASDHGSTDGTLALLTRWRERGLALDILPTRAPGCGSAANFFHLLREHDPGHADYVALCDQDDVWRPDRLRRAIAEMERTRAVGYSCDVRAVWPDGRAVTVRKSQPQRSLDYLLEPAGPGCTYVLHRDLALSMREELRKAPERFTAIRQHDWVIYAYARIHDLRWLIDRYEALNYRQHDGNEVGANVGLAGIRRRWDRATKGTFRREVVDVGRLWPGPHQRMLARFERFSMVDQLVIALSAPELRRRPKDQLALFSMIVLRVLR